MSKYEMCHCLRDRTINDMWRRLMWHCLKNGYSYIIKKGSYEGDIRVQLLFVSFLIEEPWTRPLAVHVPEHLGFSAPTDEEKIEQYWYEYLMTDKEHETEEYTYGQYINEKHRGKSQLDRIIELLNISKGKTNQATLTIGDPKVAHLENPPCLRTIDFKVIPGNPPELQMTVFFRSWDLFVGIPENLGGLQLLKEYVIENLKFKVKDGPITGSSSGLHIYGQYFPMIEELTRKKIKVIKKTEDECEVEISDK